jgi:pimeloyl-ACP methyl ester carboxylesterase
MTEDIIRFMDDKKIVMATIGGHGYGAKVAAATAIGNMNRFTGVIQYEGGPLEHQYYEAYQELTDAIRLAHSLPIGSMELGAAHKALSDNILDKNWARVFREALVQEGSSLAWRINIEALYQQTKKHSPDIAAWRQNCGGLWPGQTLALFAAHSRWVHLSTNTLPFYNVFPRLQEQFPHSINIHASDLEGPETHWLHNHPDGDAWALNQRMARFLKW